MLAPTVALALYPRANWLFAFVLLGISIILINGLTAKDPTPQEVADRAEHLLNGTFGGYDVDDYEHLNPKNRQVRELWSRSMVVGGLPEVWARLDEERKSEVEDIIWRLRQLGVSSSHR